MFVVAAVPFAPTEAVLVSAAALAAAGKLSLSLVLLVGAAGCATSDLVNYALGRGAGQTALNRVRRSRTALVVLDWVAERIEKRPVLILVVARFLPAGGIVAAALCGMTRYPLRTFVPISLLGSVTWTVYAALLGYIGASVTDRPVIGIVVGLVLAGLLAVVSGFVGRRLPRARGGPREELAGQRVG